MKKEKKFTTFILLPAFLLLLNSCIGISADILMRGDGSSRMVLEYRFSRRAETVGRLDGNQGRPVVPVGREDWERTASRVAGMRVVSFSSRETPQDVINKVTLDFKDTDALLKFLDPSGKRAVLSTQNGLNILHLTLNESVPSQINADLLDLLRQVSPGYKFALSFTAAGNATLALTDGAGNAVLPPPDAEIVASGKKVSLLVETVEILERTDGMGVRIEW